MIPKIIHYCWFGGNPKPELIKNCIASWKKYCPDYEIIEWNEENFNVNCCQYTKEAYEAKKWAFVSDYARLYALYNHGGIYLDTDMEVLKPLDKFLDDTGFLAFEAKDYVCLGIIGAVKNHSFIDQLKHDYDNSCFIKKGGNYNTTTNVKRMRSRLLENGLKNNGKEQKVCEMTIYPQKLFFPYNLGMVLNHKPKKAYTIHLAAASWKNDDVSFDKKKALRLFVVNRIRNIIGTDTVERIRDK